MDLTPTAEQRAFRAGCRAWLKDNLPWDYGTGLPPLFDDLAEEVEFGRNWQRSLAGAGYVGVTWPTEYGGRGADPVFNYIVQEERARAPELVGRIAVNLVGPCLLAHGTEAQKQRWLPGILNAEQLIRQLFSEPDAGGNPAGGRWQRSWLYYRAALSSRVLARSSATSSASEPWACPESPDPDPSRRRRPRRRPARPGQRRPLHGPGPGHRTGPPAGALPPPAGRDSGSAVGRAPPRRAHRRGAVRRAGHVRGGVGRPQSRQRDLTGN